MLLEYRVRREFGGKWWLGPLLGKSEEMDK